MTAPYSELPVQAVPGAANNRVSVASPDSQRRSRNTPVDGDSPQKSFASLMDSLLSTRAATKPAKDEPSGAAGDAGAEGQPDEKTPAASAAAPAQGTAPALAALAAAGLPTSAPTATSSPAEAAETGAGQPGGVAAETVAPTAGPTETAPVRSVSSEPAQPTSTPAAAAPATAGVPAGVPADARLADTTPAGTPSADAVPASAPSVDTVPAAPTADTPAPQPQAGTPEPGVSRPVEQPPAEGANGPQPPADPEPGPEALSPADGDQTKAPSTPAQASAPTTPEPGLRSGGPAVPRQDTTAPLGDGAAPVAGSPVGPASGTETPLSAAAAAAADTAGEVERPDARPVTSAAHLVGQLDPSPRLARVEMPTIAQPAVPPAPAEPLHTQLATAVRPLRRSPDGTYRLALELRPADLGTVRVDVLMRGGEVSLRVLADNGETRALLNDMLPKLRAELQGAGLATGDLAVGDDTDAPAGRFTDPRAAAGDRDDSGRRPGTGARGQFLGSRQLPDNTQSGVQSRPSPTDTNLDVLL